MMLGARTAAWAKSGAPLPYLRRVAYLEGHGDEYLVIPIYVSSSVQIECTAKFVELASGNKAYFGGGDGNLDREILLCCDKTRLLYRCGDKQNLSVTGGNFDFNSKHIFTWRKDELVIDGISYFPTNSSSFESSRLGLAFFKTIRGGKEWKSTSMMLFCAKINTPDNAFDLIPVLDLSGRPAMYDEVSGQFFYNQGTGEFTWGELET